MSLQRFIYPQIWNSDDFNCVSDLAKLLFIGIFSTADDEGRRKASPSSLKGDIFPQRTDLDLKQIEELRDELGRQGLVRIYTGSDGTMYLDLPNWGKYQHPKYRKESALPAYDPDRDLMRSAPDPESVCGLDRAGLERAGTGRKERRLGGGQSAPAEPARTPVAAKAGYSREFENVWICYPPERRKLSNKRATFNRCAAIVRNGEASWPQLTVAAQRYAEAMRQAKISTRFIQMAEVFFGDLKGRWRAALEPDFVESFTRAETGRSTPGHDAAPECWAIIDGERVLVDRDRYRTRDGRWLPLPPDVEAHRGE